jgi:hypothetical protein
MPPSRSSSVFSWCAKTSQGRSVGVPDPDLVLAGVATGRIELVEGGKASLDKTLLGGEDGFRIGDLNTRVVEGSEVSAPPLVQREVERRIGDRELRVDRAHLLWLRSEHGGVEGDGPIYVRDVDCQVGSQDSHECRTSRASGLT